MKRFFICLTLLNFLLLKSNNFFDTSLLTIILMVKNEEAAMQPTLQPFINAGIHNYLILDTGSTDKTIQITQELFKKHTIKNGYIVEQPFIDFATSRNYALKCAEEKFPHAAFFLMIDAEWIIHNVTDLLQFCNDHKDDPTQVYGTKIIMHKNNSTHCVYNLIKAHKGIHYTGAVHEAVTTNSYTYIPANFYFELPTTEYGEEKSKKRWERDRELLHKEHLKDPKNPRTLFYLAQTCACLNDIQGARDYLILRCALKSDAEEDFVSHYRLATMYDTLDDWSNALKYYLKAYNMRPTRVEPLVWLAYHYLSSKEYHLSYLFAKAAVDIPYPKTDTLFVENEMYEFMRYDVLNQATSYVR